jgi:hypothetical protein
VRALFDQAVVVEITGENHRERLAVKSVATPFRHQSDMADFRFIRRQSVPDSIADIERIQIIPTSWSGEVPF